MVEEISSATTIQNLEGQKQSDKAENRDSSFLDQYQARVAQDPSPFGVLGVSREMSWEEVQNRYQQSKVDLHHYSDQFSANQESLAQSMNVLREMNTAYETLRDLRNPDQFFKNAKNLHDLVDRLQLMQEAVGGLVPSQDEATLTSWSGVMATLKEIISLREQLPQQVISQRYVVLLPEGEIKQKVIHELELWSKLSKDLKEGERQEDWNKIKTALRAMLSLGYSSFSRWDTEKNKLEVIDIPLALQRVVDIQQRIKSGRKIFTQAVKRRFRLTI